MCWVLPLGGPIRVGSYGGRTQNNIGSDCTTGSNKFGDPKALGPYPILLDRPNSLGSCIRTQD
jgi:hypothetical protein